MFKTQLNVERDMSNDNAWILQKDLIYINSQYRITVKSGFDFDFASVPDNPLLTWLFPRDGQETDRASCVHDALYSCQILSKTEADHIFLSAMEDDNVGGIKRKLMFIAVSLFGKSSWNKCKETSNFYKKYVSVKIL